MASCLSSGSCSSSASQTGRRGWKSHLTARNGVILGLVALTGTGLAFGGGWGWLVAVGAAPIILSLLPCAVMCGLGLCMHKMGSKQPPSPTIDGAGGTIAGSLSQQEPVAVPDPISGAAAIASTAIHNRLRGVAIAADEAISFWPGDHLGAA